VKKSLSDPMGLLAASKRQFISISCSINLYNCWQRNFKLQNAVGSGLAGESGGIILFHVYLTLIEFIKTPGQLQRE
jgi:hypothetical protein